MESGSEVPRNKPPIILVDSYCMYPEYLRKRLDRAQYSYFFNYISNNLSHCRYCKRKFRNGGVIFAEMPRDELAFSGPALAGPSQNPQKAPKRKDLIANIQIRHMEPNNSAVWAHPGCFFTANLNSDADADTDFSIPRTRASLKAAQQPMFSEKFADQDLASYPNRYTQIKQSRRDLKFTFTNWNKLTWHEQVMINDIFDLPYPSHNGMQQNNADFLQRNAKVFDALSTLDYYVNPELNPVLSSDRTATAFLNYLDHKLKQENLNLSRLSSMAMRKFKTKKFLENKEAPPPPPKSIVSSDSESESDIKQARISLASLENSIYENFESASDNDDGSDDEDDESDEDESNASQGFESDDDREKGSKKALMSKHSAEKSRLGVSIDDLTVQSDTTQNLSNIERMILRLKKKALKIEKKQLQLDAKKLTPPKRSKKFSRVHYQRCDKSNEAALSAKTTEPVGEETAEAANANASAVAAAALEPSEKKARKKHKKNEK